MKASFLPGASTSPSFQNTAIIHYTTLSRNPRRFIEVHSRRRHYPFSLGFQYFCNYERREYFFVFNHYKHVYIVRSTNEKYVHSSERKTYRLQTITVAMKKRFYLYLGEHSTSSVCRRHDGKLRNGENAIEICSIVSEFRIHADCLLYII